MDPHFTRDGELLVPSAVAAGPWSDQMVSGRDIAGLVAWAVERDGHDADGHDGDDAERRIARLTIDMFRPVPMKPLRVTTTTARAGRRIRVVDVSVQHDDVEVTRASALLLLPGEHPSTDPWTPPADTMPPPDALARTGGTSTMTWEFRLGTALGQGQGRTWIRELGPFVDDERASPLVRTALASDFVNPLANSGSEGLAFINTDLTVALTRYPTTEWIGLEVTGHLGADGIGLGSAWLHDGEGRFGQTVTAALPDPRLLERFRPAD